MPNPSGMDKVRQASSRSLEDHFAALKSAFSPKGVPCSAGSFVVQAKDLILYYGKPGRNEVSRRLDFSTDLSEGDLRMLSEACDPATFGRNNEAVLDESYRKAGKLDVEHFSTNFDPEHCGLIDQLRPFLLEGHDEKTGIRTELYKLNVYGPGSFFKAHKDTPRSDDMFASLVVVLPTRHEGGSLLFEHNDQPFAFDSAIAIANATGPSVAYATFFSDIDHEVDVVEKGYRVTLTYNLYYTSPPAVSDLPVIWTTFEDQLRESLQALVDDTNILPNSGLVGFCLRHQYTAAALKDKRLLKGSDAVLAKVCDDLGLKFSVRIIYQDHNVGVSVLMDKEAKMPYSLYDEYLYRYLTEDCGGLLLDPDNESDRMADVKIHWVTERRAQHVKPFKEAIATYGNEPSIETCYWHLCFIVEVNRGGVESAEIGRIKRNDDEDEDEAMTSD